MKRTAFLLTLLAIGIHAAAGTFTVRFLRPSGWTGVPRLHAWYESNLADNQEMKAVSGHDGWYEYTLTSSANVHLIFNNGGWDGGQTATLYNQLPFDMCLTAEGTGGAITYTACPGDTPDAVTIRFRRPDGWTAPPHLHLYRPGIQHSNRVVYEICVHNYSEEGTFRAVTADLDRLQSLGVNTLWLMPIFPIGQEGRAGAYGSPYATRDYRSVNSGYGTLDDFKTLVSAAHARGMEVWLDIACNHTAKDHPWVISHPEYYAEKDGQRPYSPYNWNDVYKLDYSNSALRAEMIAALRYWITECDIDGYRCDHVDGVPMGFWAEATRAINRTKPLFWLAEADKEEAIGPFNADYAWGFNDQLTAFAASGSVNALRDACLALFNDAAYASGSKMTYLTNHDLSAYNGTERSRFGDYYRPLLVLSFTLYDMPLLYNGQEIGKTVTSFTDKQAIDWNTPDTEILALCQKLCALRASSGALRDGSGRGPLSMLSTNDDDNILAYRRQGGDNDLVVLLNLSGTERSFTLTNAPEGEYADYLNGGTSSLSTTLTLPAYGYSILVK